MGDCEVSRIGVHGVKLSKSNKEVKLKKILNFISLELFFKTWEATDEIYNCFQCRGQLIMALPIDKSNETPWMTEWEDF